MAETIKIVMASVGDEHDVAVMVGELLQEIMTAIGENVFQFDLEETEARLNRLVAEGKYIVFVARLRGDAVGFITLYESYALYAEGAFGTIPELYVWPEYRSLEIGKMLIEQAKAYGREHGWKRLEVTTPPLPQFDKTLAFYEREGFAISGGRKLKITL